MDPSRLGNAEWTDIGRLLTDLWIIVGLVVFLATNMIVGHIMIPSLVASHHLSQSFQKSRPIFYVLAVVSFVVALLFLVQVIDLAGVLRRFWADYWI